MSDRPDALRTTATAVRQAGPRLLAIDWADGAETRYEVRELRLACGCAHCIDEWTGEARLDPESVPTDVHPVKIERVGRYAIGIEWSDGHAAGVYPFARLRELAG